ncbi:Prolyl oligopeptidase family [Cedecea lapagei]|uniref:Prolyl oligopeptidase family n=1 Tax=Cedecea lapagei TaxID=158823 RepID=A0A3S4IEB7_9ENTR|nr:Prolyl oligopeptidase family [Cedecea lapagei]
MLSGAYYGSSPFYYLCYRWFIGREDGPGFCFVWRQALGYSAVEGDATRRRWTIGKYSDFSPGAQSNIAIPILTVIAPEKPNGQAVLVAAGGGYKRIEMGTEAWPAAQWLVARGYTAYVLSYRLPSEGWADGNLVALQDAQRALRIVRERENNVSVLGFSAGGHLLGLAATRTGCSSYPAQDRSDDKPAFADRAALIYPVITLEKPYEHTSTHKILVGKDASSAENAKWSVQNYVTPNSPPFFLVQAEDDPISDPQNTLIMAAACERQHIPVEMHRYSSGGHGFGMGKPGTPTVKWPEHYEKWLAKS